jgi:hypothetical protein
MDGNVPGLVDAIQSEYGMRPVLPYEQPVKIGDIGTIGKNGAWEPVSTLRERFDTTVGGIRPTKGREGVWKGQSGKDVKIVGYGRGQTSKLVSQVAHAKARVEIEFNS